MVILNMSELKENYFDDEEIDELLRERKESIGNDNRPSISTDFNKQHNVALHKRDEEVIIKRIKKSEEEKEKDRKTIMDMPLKDIIQKTSETTSNFWEDYKIKLVETKYNYEKKYDLDDKKTTWSNVFSIYSIAFVEYMKESDNILYIGIFLFIISVIIYIFIITSS